MSVYVSSRVTERGALPQRGRVPTAAAGPHLLQRDRLGAVGVVVDHDRVLERGKVLRGSPRACASCGCPRTRPASLRSRPAPIGIPRGCCSGRSGPRSRRTSRSRSPRMSTRAGCCRGAPLGHLRQGRGRADERYLPDDPADLTIGRICPRLATLCPQRGAVRVSLHGPGQQRSDRASAGRDSAWETGMGWFACFLQLLVC